MNRFKKILLFGGLLAVLAGATAVLTQAQTEPTAITVYKSPTCGCCAKWVAHLQANGFETKVQEMPDVTPMKARFGVPISLRSCHTAVVNGYVVEGHVPADLIKQMVAEKPEIAGIAVPGMPIGSPGMEVEGRPNEAYDIVAFTKEGETSIYASR